MQDEVERNRPVKLVVSLRGRAEDEEAPALVLHAVSREGEVVESIKVKDGAEIKLGQAALSAQT